MQTAQFEPTVLTTAVEALLFAADRPLGVPELSELIGRADESVVAESAVYEALQGLQAAYAARQSAIVVAEVASGWELRSRPDVAPYIHALFRKKPVRLSRAALEVLSVVAYRQPCTRADIDEVRGVDSSQTLRQLLERGLLRILGKADDVGRPILYGTSPKFLEFFGLNSLGDLPTLREFTELTEEHVVKLQELEETLRANQQPDDETGAAEQELPGLETPAVAPSENNDA